MSTAAALSNLAKKRKVPTKTKNAKVVSKPTPSNTDDEADDLESALNYNFEDASLDLADFSDDDTAMVVPASHLKKLNESAFLADDEEPSAKKLRLSKEAEIKIARDEKKAAEQKAENEKNTKNRLQRGISSDPSLRYFNIPSEIPTVKDARQFFEYDLPITAFNRKKGKSKTVSGDSDVAVQQKNPIDFKVTVGSVTRWRSLAKLAVRSFGPKTMEDLVREKLSAAIQERNARTSKAGKAELGSAANAAAEADLKGQIEREVAAAMSKVAETGNPSTRSAPVKLSRRQRKTMNKVTAGEEIWERPQIGLFAPGSHDIVPGIELCPAHHPSINTAINEISQVINALQVTGFNDKTGAGQLRFIAMTVATNPAAPGSVTLAGARLSSEDMKENSSKVASTQGKIQLTLVWNSRGSDAEKPKSFATPTIEKQLPQGEAALEYFATSDPTLEKVVKMLLQDRRKGVKAPPKQDKKNKNKNAKKSSLPEDHWLWQSIHVHHQNSWSHTNAIFSHDPNSWQRVFGPEAVTEVMPMKYTKEATVLKVADSKEESVKEVVVKEAEDNSKQKKDNVYPIMPFPTPARPVLHFPPTVFRQANLEGFSRIVSAVRPWIPINSRVVELYGGVGTIGLNLVDRVQSIICSDENPNNAKCFLATTSSLPLAMRAGRAIKYIPKNATGMVELGALHKSVLTTKDLFPSPEQLLKQQLALLSDDEESEDEEKEEKKMSDKKGVKAKKEKSKLTVDNVEEDIEEFRSRVLDLSTADTMLLPPNVCIVDPPRKGLEPEILAALAIPKASVSTSNATAATKNVMGIQGLKISGSGNKIASTKIQSQPLTATSHLERLIYVSCGFKALKRDAEQLATPQGGGWRIAHAEGHILFPGADHLETLVVFVR